MTDNDDARDHEEPMIEGDTELLDDDFSMGAVETIASAITKYANKHSGEHQPMLKFVKALDELELDDSAYCKVLRILEIGAKRETFMALGPLSHKGRLLAELGQE
ncbi:hypothetical protein MRB53_016730 [Persea americana]|uniref:Uncharacterized protein n=1 Tax=Persea americana TaxID=3435 RepID=A0ACC2M345_PERAE|nr:hypothetical protein MRB53_016730 [Persea americana]